VKFLAKKIADIKELQKNWNGAGKNANPVSLTHAKNNWTVNLTVIGLQKGKSSNSLD
jgi:hypothetical protein